MKLRGKIEVKPNGEFEVEIDESSLLTGIVALLTALMRRLWLPLLLLAVSSPLRAQLEIPQMAGDAGCVAGQPGKVWANSSTNKIRKCQDGVISDWDSAVANFGTNMGPKGDEYDPDRKPDDSTMYLPCSDEFNNGATGTWANVNNTGLTITDANDYRVLSEPTDSGTNQRGVYCVPDNSVDWTFTAKLTASANSASINHNEGGILAVDGGTATAPTRFFYISVYVAGGNAHVNTGSSASSGFNISVPGTVGTNIEQTSAAGLLGQSIATEVCLQIRYVVATKVMTSYYAADCRNWEFGVTGNTRTFTAAPLSVELFVSSFGGLEVMKVQWARFRQDSTGNSGTYLVGQP